MKSIDERAEEFASVYPKDLQHFVEECYKAGAESQIDSSALQLSDHVKNYQFSRDEFIEYACKWLKEWCNEHGTFKSCDIPEFMEAMFNHEILKRLDK